MTVWPEPGTRVAVRYRLPVGSVPPLNDVVGHLVHAGDRIVVRPKSGAEVTVDAADVVSVRPLAAAPVRNPDIRRLEHAAALAWPGTEQLWLDGWLLRAAGGYTARANSAVPVGPEAGPQSLGAIIEFYEQRGLPPLVASPDRLVRLPAGVQTNRENLVMTRVLDEPIDTDGETQLHDVPDDEWRRLYEREVPPEVLTAVIDGEVAFGSLAGASQKRGAVGRAAVTAAPNGTKWVGLSAVHVTSDQRRRGLGRAVCDALLAWGLSRGAERAYLQVLADNSSAIAMYAAMGFTEHHRTRYADARDLVGRTL